MAQMMTNIPRRKIYETMLEFEDGLMGLEILTYSEEKFIDFKPQFEKESFPIIVDKFYEIEALLIMFLDNEKFENDELFYKILKSRLKEKEKTRKQLLDNKYIPKRFKEVLPLIDEILISSNVMIPDLEKAKNNLKLLDEFNHIIPKILELRRDKMK